MTTTSQGDRRAADDGSGVGNPMALDSTHAGHGAETKASVKTTELFVYVAAVVGVLLAAYLVKTTGGHPDYFRADQAWFYVVLLSIGYMASRGLAKSGSRHNSHRS